MAVIDKTLAFLMSQEGLQMFWDSHLTNGMIPGKLGQMATLRRQAREAEQVRASPLLALRSESPKYDPEGWSFWIPHQERETCQEACPC